MNDFFSAWGKRLLYRRKFIRITTTTSLGPSRELCTVHTRRDRKWNMQRASMARRGFSHGWRRSGPFPFRHTGFSLCYTIIVCRLIPNSSFRLQVNYHELSWIITVRLCWSICFRCYLAFSHFCFISFNSFCFVFLFSLSFFSPLVNRATISPKPIMTIERINGHFRVTFE